MKNNWEEKTLEEVCEKIFAGGDKPLNFCETKNEKYKIPVFANGIKNNGLLGYTDIPTVTENAITISARGTIGFVCKRYESFCPIVRLIVIIPKTNKISIEFLYYLSKTLMPNSNGSSIPQLTIPKFKDSIIKLPPLQEQKQIVERLDKAFENIDKLTEIAKKNLDNAKELFGSYLNKLFTENTENWEETTLNDICEIERGASPRPIKNFITNDKNGVNWVKIGDVSENDKYVVKTEQKITKIGAMKSRQVKVGDFILSNSMSYGRPYIMKIDGCIHDGWFVLRFNKNIINQDFLYVLLSSSFAQEQYNKLAAGSVVKNISSDLIKKVKIPLPSLPQQKQIVKVLDNLQEKTKKLEEIYNKKLELAKELKQSILHKELSC